MATHPYAEATSRIAARAAAEADPAINPRCRGFALTHGGPTPRAALLLHGYTNCPQQFRALAGQLHARGLNVYVPRLPHHGLADRLSPDQARLRARDLRAFLADALAVGAGLGGRLSVAGISAGGVLAALAAQGRPEVDRAVIIAPVLGTPRIAGWATLPLVWAASVLPNRFIWWDERLKDRDLRVPHAYPRFSTRAAGAVVRLGLGVLRAARRAAPAAREVVVVINDADEAVTTAPIELLAARWRARGARLRLHRFPADLGLTHDCIDPDQERQQTDRVYPVLLDLIAG